MTDKRIFGTDGVRGVANELLTPELAFGLARAAVSVLHQQSRRCKVLIGRDSRVSGPMLEAAMSAGFQSMGATVLSVDIAPTPAVAYLTKTSDVDFGVMISASHNPVPDNGIKFFSKQGLKLDDDIEIAIEKAVFKMQDQDEFPRPTGVNVGTSLKYEEGIQAYIHHLLNSLPVSLEGLKIVVDAAYGAAAPYVQQVFSQAGAEVIAINDVADGTMINVKCGSTNTALLQHMVRQEQADMGFAFDGDADRVIAVDGQGNIVNGDAILYVWAKYLQETKQLPTPAIVATVMSNMGLELALAKAGVKLLRTQVGDRYVLQRLCSEDLYLGGEQSGHIIYRKANNTGDGMLTGLQLAAICQHKTTSLASLMQGLSIYPQKLVNVRVDDKTAIMKDTRLQDALLEAEEQLERNGRILVRPSGTEPVVRVMVEAKTDEMATRWVNKLAHVIEELNR